MLYANLCSLFFSIARSKHSIASVYRSSERRARPSTRSGSDASSAASWSPPPPPPTPGRDSWRSAPGSVRVSVKAAPATTLATPSTPPTPGADDETPSPPPSPPPEAPPRDPAAASAAPPPASVAAARALPAVRTCVGVCLSACCVLMKKELHTSPRATGRLSSFRMPSMSAIGSSPAAESIVGCTPPARRPHAPLFLRSTGLGGGGGGGGGGGVVFAATCRCCSGCGVWGEANGGDSNAKCVGFCTLQKQNLRGWVGFPSIEEGGGVEGS